jgi:hypothetical protein
VDLGIFIAHVLYCEEECASTKNKPLPPFCRAITFDWTGIDRRLCLATGGSPAALGDEERNICPNLVAAKLQA